MFINVSTAHHELGSNAWKSTVFGEGTDTSAFLRVWQFLFPSELFEPLGILTKSARWNSKTVQIRI